MRTGNEHWLTRFRTVIWNVFLVTVAMAAFEVAGAPVAWERVYYDPIPGDAGIGLHGVTYGNGRFVAVGSDIAISTDGSTWQRFPRPCQSLLLNVTYGGGKFVAVGGAKNGGGSGVDPVPSDIIVSEDGVNWTKVMEEYDPENLKWPWLVQLSDVIWVDGRFIAVGHSTANMIITSTDGVLWEQVSTTVQPYCESIAYGLGTYVIAGGAVLTSADSTNWLQHTVGPRGDLDMLGQVRFGAGGFVMTGVQPGRVLTSPDGLNWSVAWQEVGSTACVPYGIEFGERERVCVGLGPDMLPMVWAVEKDGKWRPQDVTSVIPPPPSSESPYLPLSDVAFGNGRFVAVGWSHLILVGTEAPPPPTLSNLRINQAGTLEFVVSVTPNTAYRIESSEDLLNWSLLTGGVSQSNSVRVTDSPTNSIKARFYRAVTE